MKVEIGTKRPEYFKDTWEGQYEAFSHLEYVCGIPHILVAITTIKENGKPNLCFHAWNCFQGDGEGYFAYLTGINQGSHTYANIERTGEFCVNFLSKQYYDRLMATIKNGADEDEFALGDFELEPASHVAAPRIKESFLTLECKKEHVLSLSGNGASNLIIGRVVNVAMEEEYSKGMDKKYGDEGFMLNIHAPKDISTGEGDTTGVAILKIDRVYS